MGEMLVPSSEVVRRQCSGINEGERHTELQNLTERVFPALTMTHSYEGRELATRANLAAAMGEGQQAGCLECQGGINARAVRCQAFIGTRRTAPEARKNTCFFLPGGQGTGGPHPRPVYSASRLWDGGRRQGACSVGSLLRGSTSCQLATRHPAQEQLQVTPRDGRRSHQGLRR